MNRSEATAFIKDLAAQEGFIAVGIAKAEHMTEEAQKLEQWLNDGRHGEMKYMERPFNWLCV